MKISFLIPSYNRIINLESCIKYINKNTSNNVEKEIILCISDGDEKTLQFATDNNIRYITTPLSGYNNLHHYYNELAKVSTGDFLFILNDDSYIVTPDWDMAFTIYKSNNPICVIDRNKSFVLIHRSILETIGYISLHPYVDTWLINFGNIGNLIGYIPDIIISHNSHESYNLKNPINAISDEEVEQIKKDVTKFKQIMKME